MNQPSIFYHVACSWPNNRSHRPVTTIWKEIIQEQVQQWDKSGLMDIANIYVGINGTEQEYEKAKTIFPSKTYCWYNGFDVPWEVPTINNMIEILKSIVDDTPILYHHTKAVSCNDNPLRMAWRKEMQWYCIENWKICIKSLEQIEACGVHWLTPENCNKLVQNSPIFAGNFFWAKSDFLKTLPKIIDKGDRMDTENWISSGERIPNVIDFNPGYPSLSLCSRRNIKNITKFVQGQKPTTVKISL